MNDAAYTATPAYVGRFAPSPSGPLHRGSLVAALASRLDALAHDGRWLVRIEDVDWQRERPGAAQQILEQLSTLGFDADAEIQWQSTRGSLYEAAFDRLRASGFVYPCACSRREIAQMPAAQDGSSEHIYPGTCRHGMPPGRDARAWRLKVDDVRIVWHDRVAGAFDDRLAQSTGDFVLRRADGMWSYQLAVVVDDADQGVTHVVRGADLIGSTARQVLLQRLLSLPTPHYLHVPLVTDPQGRKLSKSEGAAALDLNDPVATLEAASVHLGLPQTGAHDVAAFWSRATDAWRASGWIGTRADKSA